MNRFSLFIALYLCIPVFCFAQNKQKTNLEIFEESISAGLEKFIYYPEINRNFLFIFLVNPDEKDGNKGNGENITKFLTSVIKKTAGSNKINFSFAKDRGNIQNDSNFYILIMQVNRLETRYTGFKKNKFLGEKTLTRNILVNISLEIESYDKKFNLKDFISVNREDEINFDGFETMESSQYYFTHSEPPEVGVFERIIFPVLLITATAATTILFFVIRSK